MKNSILSFFIVLTFCCVFYNNTNAQVDIRKNKVYTSVDIMPCFIECGDNLSKEERLNCCDEKLRNYMLNHLKYPAEAKRANVQGSVIVRFTVDTDGSVVDTELVENIGKGCGTEVLRVMHRMPKWETPGMQNNENVAVQFDMPIKFSLDEISIPRGKITAREIVTAAVVVGGFIYAFKKMRDIEKKKKKKREEERKKRQNRRN